MPAAVSIDARQVGRIAREMRRAAPEAWRATRLRLREIGEVVAQDARQRASYSSRIPGSVKVRVTAAGNVRVSIGGPGAPDAVPIENKGRGHVRHPVFGNRDVWTDKNSRPASLIPAYEAHREWALREIEKAYWKTFDRVWGRA